MASKHAPLLFSMALAVALASALPAAAQAQLCPTNTTGSICFAAPARGSLSTDCSDMNGFLTLAMGRTWTGSCSATPPPPFNQWPVQSSVQIVYTCMAGLRLLGQPITYSAWISSSWTLSGIVTDARLTAALQALYTGPRANNAALWLSYSCKAARMPAGGAAALGRFMACTGSGGLVLNPPPPAGEPPILFPPFPPKSPFSPGQRMPPPAPSHPPWPIPPRPPSPPDILGYFRVGCALTTDNNYFWHLASSVVGNKYYGLQPSVRACAAAVRSDVRGTSSYYYPHAFGLTYGGYCYGLQAYAMDLVSSFVRANNNTASWVSDTRCSQACSSGAPGETCGGYGFMTVYKAGGEGYAGNGVQECSVSIRPSSSLPPMLSLSEVSLFDARNQQIDLRSLYGVPDPGSAPRGSVQFASLSSWYWDLNQTGTDMSKYVWSTDKCFDGSLDTCCGSSSCMSVACNSSGYPQGDRLAALGFRSGYYQDLYPMLTVTYPCSNGHTLGSLSRVEVHTCKPSLGLKGDNKPAYINSFQVDFLGADGKQDADSYLFSGTPPAYTTGIVITPTALLPPAPSFPSDPNAPGYPNPPWPPFHPGYPRLPGSPPPPSPPPRGPPQSPPRALSPPPPSSPPPYLLSFFLENYITRRWAFDTGNAVLTANRGSEGGWTSGGKLTAPLAVTADADYDDKAEWRLERATDATVDALFHITNIQSNRYLFDSGSSVDPLQRGKEGGWAAAPRVVTADANYYNRAVWRITPTQDSASTPYLFMIENLVTRRFLMCTGAAMADPNDRNGAEQGVASAPPLVSVDANYYNRAIWRITGLKP